MENLEALQHYIIALQYPLLQIPVVVVLNKLLVVLPHACRDCTVTNRLF